MSTHNHPDIDLIREALAGERSQEEMEEIQARLAIDPDFKAAYRNCEWEIAILKAADRAAVKEKLRQDSQDSSTAILPLWGWVVSLAAVLFVLVLVLRPDSLSSREYALSLVIPVPSGQIRGEVDSTPGLDAYQDQQWSEAIDIWASQETLSRQESLLLGSAYLQIQQYQNAEGVFSDLTVDSTFEDIAKWNYCLALILQEKTEKARPLLEEIAGSAHYQQEEAEKLLDLIR